MVSGAGKRSAGPPYLTPVTTFSLRGSASSINWDLEKVMHM